MKSERGYTVIELLVTVVIMMVVSGSVMNGVMKMTRVNGSVSNRTEMHSSVRNATELMQQELGQAGRITLPVAYPTMTAVAAVGAATVTVTPDASGIFANELLTVDTGNDEETVTVTAADATTFTATFEKLHNANARVSVYGGFKQGVVPPGGTGSSATTLKMFGDINGDGEIVYVEYVCDPVNQHSLYRLQTKRTDAAKAAPAPDKALLNNVYNPVGVDCFQYQVVTQAGEPFVTDVAVTLTVRTPRTDPITGLYQQETKALLNVSPRNVFNVWQLSGQGVKNRVQATPQWVTNLINQ